MREGDFSGLAGPRGSKMARLGLLLSVSSEEANWVWTAKGPLYFVMAFILSPTVSFLRCSQNSQCGFLCPISLPEMMAGR